MTSYTDEFTFILETDILLATITIVSADTATVAISVSVANDNCSAGVFELND